MRVREGMKVKEKKERRRIVRILEKLALTR